ncbi:MAG: hypothetical protein BGO25_17050 [Acidobacteriales bacterium 59-55]|nr:MAG: hypothetical protein BGO25_17050 [Acidobacteriales bacterium 59-55]
MLHHRPLVRRFISISLLLLFTLPLVSPLFAASTTDADVPVCCRRDGKHHCMMARTLERDSGNASQDRTASLRDRCPYNLATPAAVNLPFVLHEAQTGLISEIVTASASPVRTETIHRNLFDNSHQKRGPPSLIPSRS